MCINQVFIAQFLFEERTVQLIQYHNSDIRRPVPYL
jgi:hypothetical protein